MSFDRASESLRALLPFLLPVAACAAHTPTAPPAPSQAPAATDEPHVYVEPLEFVAPPCTAAGPSVQILSHQDGSGGKGDLCVSTDQRIRNPTSGPLWLFIDADHFSASLKEVVLERRRPEAKFVVWLFADPGYEEAVRLAPRSDIVVRDIFYVQWGHHRRPIREAFVDRIDVDADGPPWPPSLALLPTKGELNAEGLNGFFGYEEHEPLLRTEGSRASIHTVCVQTTPVAELMGD